MGSEMESVNFLLKIILKRNCVVRFSLILEQDLITHGVLDSLVIFTSFRRFLLPWRDEKHFVGNKAKGRISKRVFQENKARQIIRKTNISYPLIRTPLLPYYRRFKNSEVCSMQNWSKVLKNEHYSSFAYYLLTLQVLSLNSQTSFVLLWKHLRQIR